MTTRSETGAAEYGFDRAGKPPLLWLRCDYDDREAAKQVAAEAACGVRHGWNADLKRWEWPLTSSADQQALLRALKALFPQAGYDAAETRHAALPEPDEPLQSRISQPQYPWRREPYAHQREVVAASALRDKFLVLYEAGTGKTQAAVEAACCALETGAVQRVYIVCPTSVRAVWRQEIGLCAWIAPDDVAVIRRNPPKDHPEHEPRCSDAQYRRRQVERRATWTVMHYEAARIEAEALAPLVRGQFLVADEAHLLKNPRAQRTKAVLGWEPARAIYQTGTPVQNSPTDIFPCAHACEPGLMGTSIHDFKRRFVIIRHVKARVQKPKNKGEKPKVIRPAFDLEVGYRDMEDLRRRLAGISLRRTKDDCLDLPPKLRARRVCEMTPDQAQIYAQMQGEVKLEVLRLAEEAGGIMRIPRTSLLAQLVRLQQAADGFFPDPDSRRSLLWLDDVGKLEACDELVEEALAAGRKVVIWSRFVAPVLKLRDRYAQQGAVAIHGQTPHDDRDAAMEAFRADPDTRLFLATIQVGGLGLNLQAGSVVIFYDRWWVPAVNEQAEDRCHRSGQEQHVTVYALLTEHSIDEQVEETLEQKEAIAGQLIDGLPRDGAAEATPEAEADALSEQFVMAALGMKAD